MGQEFKITGEKSYSGRHDSYIFMCQARFGNAIEWGEKIIASDWSLEGEKLISTHTYDMDSNAVGIFSATTDKAQAELTVTTNRGRTFTASGTVEA